MAKANEDESIKARLAKKYNCYILVTCDGPQENGQMQVQMSYQGDPILASYLLEGAQNIIHEDTFEENEMSS